MRTPRVIWQTTNIATRRARKERLQYDGYIGRLAEPIATLTPSDSGKTYVVTFHFPGLSIHDLYMTLDQALAFVDRKIEAWFILALQETEPQE